jgi:hypothetical protein
MFDKEEDGGEELGIEMRGGEARAMDGRPPVAPKQMRGTGRQAE